MENWLARHDRESSGCRHPNFTMQGVICGAAELGTGRSTFKLKKKRSLYLWGHAAEEISILCGLVVTVKAPRLVNCLITRCNHGMFEARYSVHELDLLFVTCWMVLYCFVPRLARHEPAKWSYMYELLCVPRPIELQLLVLFNMSG